MPPERPMKTGKPIPADRPDPRFQTYGKHVWRQIGMTGSEYEECILCGAKIGVWGEPADPAALVPCKFEITVRSPPGRNPWFQVGRR
jgi:hypothetical protein